MQPKPCSSLEAFSERALIRSNKSTHLAYSTSQISCCLMKFCSIAGGYLLRSFIDTWLRLTYSSWPLVMKLLLPQAKAQIEPYGSSKELEVGHRSGSLGCFVWLVWLVWPAIRCISCVRAFKLRKLEQIFSRLLAGGKIYSVGQLVKLGREEFA